MIGEIALAIEMGADAVDIGKTIHTHPTLGESIGMAAAVALGSCKDLPPGKKKTLCNEKKEAANLSGWRLSSWLKHLGLNTEIRVSGKDLFQWPSQLGPAARFFAHSP
jgi:hypothetical protein